jgi:hypothetical protein
MDFMPILPKSQCEKHYILVIDFALTRYRLRVRSNYAPSAQNSAGINQ